jgi:hypothetical protein
LALRIKQGSWMAFGQAGYMGAAAIAFCALGQYVLGLVTTVIAALATWYAIDRRRRVREGRATWRW